MSFDYRTYWRQTLYAATHRAGDTPYLLTACQLLLYPPVHLGFALDEWLAPEMAITPVERPVFIVSSPRSGSALLFTLLAADPATACFSTRELLFRSPTAFVADYDALGWTLSPGYAGRLGRGAFSHRHWRSDHQYSLVPFGLTRGRIREDFAFVFDEAPEPAAVPGFVAGHAERVAP